MIELKPCPFCGQKIERYSIEADSYGISRLQINCCMDFNIMSDDVVTSFGGEWARVGLTALEKWNRRVEE